MVFNIRYIILFGEIPFGSPQEILHSNYKKPRIASNFGPVVGDLLDWMLVKDPTKRPTARDVMNHRWMREDMTWMLGLDLRKRPQANEGMEHRL